jgi:hypothetical protein
MRVQVTADGVLVVACILAEHAFVFNWDYWQFAHGLGQVDSALWSLLACWRHAASPFSTSACGPAASV